MLDITGKDVRLLSIVALAAAVLSTGLAGCGKPGNQAVAAPTKTPPVPVGLQVAQIGLMSQTLPVVGQLQSDNRVNLTSKTAGKVMQLFVNTGDTVQPGELAALLDDTDAMAALQQAQANLQASQAHLDQTRTGVGYRDVQTGAAVRTAQANLAAAESKLQQMNTAARIEDTTAVTAVQNAVAALRSAQENLNQVKEGSRQQEKTQAKLAVQTATDNLNHAQDNFNRLDTLLKEGAVSQQSRDDAKFALDQAKTGLDTAQQQASLVQEGSRSQQVMIAEAQVRQAQAALESAQGEAQRRSMSRDDVVQAEAQVHQMQAQLASAKAGTAQYAMTRQDVSVAAAQVAQAQAQVQEARLQVQDARIFCPVGGVVDTRPVTLGSSISPTTVILTIMPTRGVYFEADVPENAISTVHVGDPVTASVDAIPGKSFSGRISEIIPVADTTSRVYRVHISIPDPAGILPQNGFARGNIVTSQIRGIVIPKDALSSNVGDNYVYVVKQNHAKQQYVVLGSTNDTQALVTSGLQPGDQYVTAGKDSLTDGALVSIQKDVRPAVGA